MRSVLILLALSACSGEAPTPAPTDAPVDAAMPADVRFDLKDLAAQATDEALVPSPAEVQRNLEHAGLTTRLASLVSEKPIVVDKGDNDEVAVRTGIVLARLVIATPAGKKEDLVADLAALQVGMAKLGAGEDTTKAIGEISARVANEAATREDLSREMDELAGMMVPDVEYKVGDRALPLIRAGAWLEGAWLVTSAIQAEGRYDVATGLLKQPAVVGYFRQYLSAEGKQVAPGDLASLLDKTLTTLEAANAKETLGQEDVAAIHDAVGAVLSKVQE